MEKPEKVYYNSDCPVTRERHTWIESFSGGKLDYGPIVNTAEQTGWE